jgi:hypothetical protein
MYNKTAKMEFSFNNVLSICVVLFYEITAVVILTYTEDMDL